MKTLPFIFFLFLCLTNFSCDNSISEPKKIGVHEFINLSNDVIDRIEVRLIDPESRKINDIISINKDIEIGDSLIFQYNTENFLSSARETQFFTTVFFKKQSPINNILNDTNLVSGRFSVINNVILQLYIGNTKMVPCARKKKEFPGINLEATKCDIEALYR
jgi:ASC-1-like (ASCH) protein